MTDVDLDMIPESLDRLRSSMSCDRRWLVNRLTVLWLAAGYRKGEAEATAWLSEIARLLQHVPADILSGAIDQAVKASRRGFLPSVGEILAIAEPALQKREAAIRQLEALAAAPVAAEPPVPAPDLVTPDEVAAILEEFGIKTETGAADRPRGPARMPTAEDYAAMGVSAEQLAASRAAAAEERASPTAKAQPVREDAGPWAVEGDTCPYCHVPDSISIQGDQASCAAADGCGKVWHPMREAA